MFGIVNKLKNALHHVDMYGEPVAPLNINGKTKISTSFGGIVSLLITALVLWFFGLKVKRMVDQSDPALYQTSEGLDLMAPDTPTFLISEYNYSIGIAFYGSTLYSICDEEIGCFDYNSKIPIDPRRILNLASAYEATNKVSV
jgi:hypothetical protein